MKEGHGATKFIGWYVQYIFVIIKESVTERVKKAPALDCETLR